MSVEEIKQRHARQDVKVAVDNCIFTVIDGKLHVLLIEMKDKLRGQWALPGGLIENNENLGTASKRILREQTGVKANFYLEQL